MRAFVLAPLSEIAPALSVQGRAVAEYLGASDSGGIVVEAKGEWWR